MSPASHKHDVQTRAAVDYVQRDEQNLTTNEKINSVVGRLEFCGNARLIK